MKTKDRGRRERKKLRKDQKGRTATGAPGKQGLAKPRARQPIRAVRPAATRSADSANTVGKPSRAPAEAGTAQSKPAIKPSS